MSAVLLYAGLRNYLMFSIMTAFVTISSTRRNISGNKSFPSSYPSCLPTTENGRNGTPLARSFIRKRNGQPSNSLISLHIKKVYRFSIYGFHRYIHFLGFASIVKLIPASALRSLLISPIYQAKAAIIESTAISHYLTHLT